MIDASPGTDTASLSRLHDIVPLPPISWWPPAPGWYVVAAILLVTLTWSVWRLIVWWRKNAYRRAALTLLKRLPADGSDLPLVNEILKRVALAVWPREQVASLSGLAWLEFLDRTGSRQDFVNGSASLLGTASYVSTAPSGDVREVIAAAEYWVRHHQGPHSC